MRYASTHRLSPHLTQANTLKSNILSSSAQSTRGVLCFIGSFLAAAWGATLASFAPAWGKVAAHWPKVDSLREDLRGLLGELHPGPERLPIVSTVTGDELAGERFDADYWVSNLAEPVLFRDAVYVLLGRGTTSSWRSARTRW